MLSVCESGWFGRDGWDDGWINGWDVSNETFGSQVMSKRNMGKSLRHGSTCTDVI